MPEKRLIYQDKYGADFARRLREVARALECDPNHLVACIAFESAGTFDPAVRNPRSGATGLIQFMPRTARALGTSIEELARMTAVEQLSYVQKYFEPYRGRLKRVDDLYMAILWPRAIGQKYNFVLFSASEGAVYRQNAGLDKSRDGFVTKAEAASGVRRLLEKGLQELEAA